MFLFKTVNDLQTHLDTIRQSGKTIGFAPTMGALHQGHLSLVEKAKAECDCSVVSIFVNPTQFNESSDLEKYPRTLAADIELLSTVGNEVVFAPSVEAVYPPGLKTELELDFGQLDQVLEGAFRPGHFEGMAQVVNRLLDIVEPDKLFMGQKDFQQFTIVRSMLRQLNRKTELVVCPIVREADGLAMSSRNRRLTPTNREKAVLLSQVLKKAKEALLEKTPATVRAEAMSKFESAGFKPEYFDIVDGNTLLPITDFEETDYVVALTAVWVGDIRLIDNLIVKQPAG